MPQILMLLCVFSRRRSSHEPHLTPFRCIQFIGLGCVPLVVYAWTQVSAERKKSHPNARHTEPKLVMVALSVIPLVLVAILCHNPVLWSPTLVDSIVTPYNSPTYPLRILNSTQSKTGVVVVGEILPQAKSDSTSLHSIRYLRVSHSLLGGVWIGGEVATLDNFPPLADSNGTPLGDSIYSTFILQEAARLVNHGKGDLNHALIMCVLALVDGRRCGGDNFDVQWSGYRYLCKRVCQT